MKKFFIFGVLTLCIMLASCSPKKVVQPEPEKQPTSTLESAERKTTKASQEERIMDQEFARIEAIEESPVYLEEKGKFKDIYFDFDRNEIRSDAKPTLKDISSLHMKDKSLKVLIEGHCDERGTSEYNLALGDRRAKAARDYLTALGISSNRIEMLSYGKEKPICSEKTEECWQMNRRAHFVILREYAEDEDTSSLDGK